MLSGRDLRETQQGEKEKRGQGDERGVMKERSAGKVFNYFNAFALGQAFIRLNAPPDTGVLTQSQDELGLHGMDRRSS